jgi:ribose-phosphate pyrophosphokinase
MKLCKFSIFLILFFSAHCFGQDIKLFSGSANPQLANEVAKCLGIPLCDLQLSRFNDGEVRIQVEESIRNCDVYLLQSTCPTATSSVNDNILELYLLASTMRRASANKITAIIPYYGYARQDRKTKSRVPISASDIAILFETAGIDHVISVDLHCGQIQGFFHHIPVDNLYSSRIFVPYLCEKRDLYNLVVVSPDAGGIERAKQFIEGLSANGVESRLAIIVKQRKDAGLVEKMDLVGDVENCDVVIIDDICDTAGTLVQAARELKENGARRVFACITHPVFSGNAMEKIASSSIDELIVTDSISFKQTPPQNITQLSIAPLLAEAIRRSATGESISYLFNYDHPIPLCNESTLPRF